MSSNDQKLVEVPEASSGLEEITVYAKPINFVCIGQHRILNFGIYEEPDNEITYQISGYSRRSPNLGISKEITQ